jgi:hypothetical protein
MSFYSRSLYQDVAMNWKKTSFLYLFLLLAVCSIPGMFKIQSQVSDYLKREAPGIIRQVPVIAITKGKVSIDEPMPYVIKDPETNAPLIIIDTTGQVTSLSGSEAMVLMTSTKLIIRKGPAETRTLDLSEIDNLRIDQAKIYDWVDLFTENFAFVLYPFALLFSFLFRILQALIFGVMGMVFAKNLRVPLSYPAVISLAMVSMTPAIILDTFYNYVEVKVPLWWLISFAITMGYLFFAVKANAEH